MGNEWTLVLFTLLAQASAGLTAAGQLFGGDSPAERSRLQFSALLLMVAALAIAFFHLGNPFQGYLALSNLNSSWLSRETLFASLYVGLLGLAWLAARRPGASMAAQSLAWAAALAGLLCIVSMANIYANAAVPAWETFYTHLSFYAAAMALGCLLQVVLTRGDGTSCRSASAALWTGVAGAGLQLIGLTVYLGQLSTGPAAARQSLQSLATAWPLLALSQLCLLGGLGAAAVFWLVRRQGKAAGGWIYGSLSLLLVALLVARYLFYSTGALPLGQLS